MPRRPWMNTPAGGWKQGAQWNTENQWKRNTPLARSQLCKWFVIWGIAQFSDQYTIIPKNQKRRVIQAHLAFSKKRDLCQQDPAGMYIYILHVYMLWSLDWTKSIQTSRNVMCIQDNAGILLVFIGMLLVSSWFSWWLIAAAFLLCFVTLGNEMETTWHLATLTWAGARTRTAWQSCREICWSWSALLASNIW